MQDIASISNTAREPDHFGGSPIESVDEFKYKMLQTLLFGVPGHFSSMPQVGVHAWERCAVQDLVSVSTTARDPDHFGGSPIESVDEFR